MAKTRRIFFGKRAFVAGLILVVFGIWINGVFIFDFGRVNAFALAVPIMGVVLWVTALYNKLKGRTYETEIERNDT
jgi:hypothetical protein